ncbi:MAG TPA: GNAT family N-acetyltransferase [Candidatus Deferrimicrobium sp.]|nr:GNAT family N-acetyltransferase [Candidatus Deferrimicrobium sp.]
MFSVRNFSKEDQENAKLLMEQLCRVTGVPFNEKRWKWGVKMRLYDALRKNGMFIAETQESKKLAGMIFADISIDPVGSSTGYIRSLVVDESFRGQGIGKILISEAVKYLNEMNVDQILINVRSKTERAKKLYDKMGFKEVYSVMRYGGKGEEDLDEM